MKRSIFSKIPEFLVAVAYFPIFCLKISCSVLGINLVSNEFDFKLFRFLWTRKNLGFRKYYRKLASFLARLQGFNVPSDFQFITNEKNELQTNGFSILKNQINKSDIKKLKSTIEEMGGRTLSSNKKINSIVEFKEFVQHDFTTKFIFDADKVRNLRNEPCVDRIIEKASTIFSSYYGVPCTFLDLSAWATKSCKDAQDRNLAAQYFHRDFDFPITLKVFIYLSDVNHNSSGAFQYLLGSHNDNIFTGKRLDLSDLQQVEKNKIQSILGDSGTIFIADMEGLHRGAPVEDGEDYRLLLQLELAHTSFGGNYYRKHIPLAI